MRSILPLASNPTGGLLSNSILRHLLPSWRSMQSGSALLRGALFGLIACATYDLTNLATIKDWPLIVTVMDMIWGTALSTAVAYVGCLAGKWLG
ncbi:MAG: DUF2177 family protein [Anaerolineae bacterium]|nr:DUF2177 family protein [Anaerolineae bacterium]